jgi:mitogen-activated protein kinase 1/3
LPHVAGGATRTGKFVDSAMRYGNYSSSATEQYEQRRTARNPTVIPNGVSPRGSYPRRVPTCKSGTNEAERIEANPAGKPKTYLPNKLPVDGCNDLYDGISLYTYLCKGDFFLSILDCF